MTRTTLGMLLCWVTGVLFSEAFVVVSSNPSLGRRSLEGVHVVTIPQTSLHAEKRRRRRRNVDQDDVERNSMDDLPEFDMEENEVATKPKKTNTSNPDKITAAMMGSADAPTKSVKDLILDRSLESKFEFDEVDQASEELPDLIALARESGALDPPTGKKKARQAERRAAAIAAKESEEDNPFSKLPFVSDEEGSVSPIKLLEAGAWAGIFLLVAWEVYLNSPFFERAAPMAPVVFESLLS